MSKTIFINKECVPVSSIQNKIYRHYKSDKCYLIIGIVLNTAINKEEVLYIPLHKTEYQFFTRPIDDFFQVFPNGTRRFTEI